MTDTTTIRREIRLRINAENMLAMVQATELDRLAAIVSLQGEYHADPKVEDAAASINYWLSGLRNALTTIVNVPR